jgi:hypothetical protein
MELEEISNEISFLYLVVLVTVEVEEYEFRNIGCEANAEGISCVLKIEGTEGNQH